MKVARISQEVTVRMSGVVQEVAVVMTRVVDIGATGMGMGYQLSQ